MDRASRFNINNIPDTNVPPPNYAYIPLLFHRAILLYVLACQNVFDTYLYSMPNKKKNRKNKNVAKKPGQKKNSFPKKAEADPEATVTINAEPVKVREPAKAAVEPKVEEPKAPEPKVDASVKVAAEPATETKAAEEPKVETDKKVKASQNIEKSGNLCFAHQTQQKILPLQHSCSQMYARGRIDTNKRIVH